MRNPADSLSWQSAVDALVKKSSIHDANAAYVQQLRVPEDASDEEIQSALTKLFSQNSVSERQTVLKMITQDQAQNQERLLNQFKPEFQDQDQAQDQRQSDQCKLAVLRSGVMIDVQYKKKTYSLFKKESPFDIILAELEEGKTKVKRNEDVYKIRKGMLVVHQRNQNEELDFWRMIIPHDNAVKIFMITELHNIPYLLHPGIQRTVQKVQRHFF